MSGRPVEAVVVAIPARNEEALLVDCLRSVEVATDAFRRARPEIPVEVVVALDRCTDSSARVAAASSGKLIMMLSSASRGAACVAVLSAGAAVASVVASVVAAGVLAEAQANMENASINAKVTVIAFFIVIPPIQI